MRLLWLAEDCRAAGLKVVEIAGWQSRGVEFADRPTTVLCHHTATPKAAKGDLPTQKILIEGRSDLPGPLCQVALGRNGTVYTVASGKANQAGKGTWRGTTSSAYTIGVEAEHPGTGAWPQKQYDAYVTLCAVLARGLGVGAARVCGHREWATPAGRKTDPNFDMDRFRVEVARKLTVFQHPKPTTGDWFDMATKEELREVIAEEVAKAVKTLHEDHVVILRGTSTGSHPNNLTNIGKAVGVKQ